MAHGYMVLIAWVVVWYFDGAWSWPAVVVQSAVFARRGEAAELSCSYSTRASQGFTLEWRYAAPGTPAVQAKRVLYFNGKLYWVNSWEGRMALVQNPPVTGTASVHIYNVQPSDSGLYICQVTNPSDWSGSGQGLINLTVLMPPSMPVCKLSGNAHVGNDVTLSCQTSGGLPTPIYSWSREKGAARLPLESMVEDQRSGSLILRNLSAPFSGTYTCRATNELGEAACSLALRVFYNSTAAVIGGAVMGVFILLLLIGALAAYFLWYRRPPKHRQENQLSQVHGDPALLNPGVSPENTLLSGSSGNEVHQDLRVSQLSPLV